jgi:hypothetical protein
MKRTSVDLTFTDKSIELPSVKVPLPPGISQVIRQLPTIPRLPELPPFVPPPIGQPPACPKLSPYEAHSAKPVSLGITAPIKAGTYTVYNKGRIGLGAPAGGAPAFTQGHPVITTMRVSNVKQKLVPANPGTTYGGQVNIGKAPAAMTGTFEVKEDMGNGNYTVSTYQLQPAELQLVKRVTRVAKTFLTPATTVTFTPTPALKIMALGPGQGVKANWTSTAVDQSTGAIGVVRGSIVAIKTVDVCGHAVNAFIVRSSERFVSVSASGEVFESATNDHTIDPNNPPHVNPSQVQGCPYNLSTCDPTDSSGQMNYYMVATQLGGLFVSQITHMTTTIPPLAITVDNTATLASVKPKA